MKFNVNPTGVGKLVKWGIPILGLLIGGPIGCVIGLIVASCVSVSSKES